MSATSSRCSANMWSITTASVHIAHWRLIRPTGDHRRPFPSQAGSSADRCSEASITSTNGRLEFCSPTTSAQRMEGQMPATGPPLVAAGNDLAGQDEKLFRLRPIDRKPEKSALRPANCVLLPAHREQVMAVRRPGEVDQTLVAGRRKDPVLSALTASSACDPQLLEATSDGPRSLARCQVCDEASIRG